MDTTTLFKLRDYLIARFQEPSTWRAIMILLGGSAAMVNPERAEAYMTLAMIAAGMIGVIVPDKVMPRLEAEIDEEELPKVDASLLSATNCPRCFWPSRPVVPGVVG
jgi:hypothetical protein